MSHLGGKHEASFWVMGLSDCRARLVHRERSALFHVEPRALSRTTYSTYCTGSVSPPLSPLSSLFFHFHIIAPGCNRNESIGRDNGAVVSLLSKGTMFLKVPWRQRGGFVIFGLLLLHVARWNGHRSEQIYQSIGVSSVDVWME